MIYQHPLAYLPGLEGIALLRAWAGEYDRAVVQARLAEARRLLDNEALVSHGGVMVNRGDTVMGYRQWSATYDEPRNGLFDVEEPIMHEILDALAAGNALDAACGTGRYAGYLAARGTRSRVWAARPKCWIGPARGYRRVSSCSGTCTSCRCPMTLWTLSSPVWHWPTCRHWSR
jgi:hypothetical protein